MGKLTNTKSKKFSVMLQSDAYQKMINNTLQDKKKAQNFIASISSAVATNPALQECDAGTILSAGLVGESLNLQSGSTMGQYYLVPFNDRKRNRKVAQFQIGYKGYIQLAIRSGYYKKLNVVAIKENELVNYDPLNEEIEVDLIDDDLEREKAKTIGYYAMFEYTNGFRKTLYWSKEKMEKHALKYSMGYRAKKGYTFWEKDFDAMAIKTMLRQIISKWGIMSTELQTAYEKDQAVIEEEKVQYIDNDNNNVIIEEEQKENTNNEEEDEDIDFEEDI